MRAAAKMKPGETAGPSATDHDQVGVELFGRIEDHLDHVTRSRIRAVPHAGVAKRLRPRTSEERFDLLKMGAARLWVWRDVGQKADGMDKQHFDPFTELSCKIGSPPKGEHRSLRSVGTDQNAPYCHTVILALAGHVPCRVG